MKEINDLDAWLENSIYSPPGESPGTFSLYPSHSEKQSFEAARTAKDTIIGKDPQSKHLEHGLAKLVVAPGR
jgi:hypothetical protein